MTRDELEALDRDALLVRAESVGVPFARSLTRGELVDELLRHASESPEDRAKGFFGQARELLASVVGRGLHLVQASESDRSPPPVAKAAKVDVVPTITLAKIYLGQGLTSQAIRVLHDLDAREPGRKDVRSMLADLGAGPAPTSPVASAPQVTSSATDVFAIVGDDRSVVVAWSLPESTFREASAWGLLVVVVEPAWTGPVRHSRWIPIETPSGVHVVSRADTWGVVRVALAIAADAGLDVVAHAPLIVSENANDPEDLRTFGREGLAPLPDAIRDSPTFRAALANGGSHATRRSDATDPRTSADA
ncbi:MAG: hypothetical protein U0169_03135 [Polyangiaceae bacterium]